MAFWDRRGEGGEGFGAVEEEEKPVGLVFVTFFCNHGEEVKVVVGDFEACFFFGFPDSAFEGRFTFVHVDFSADGGPEALIRRLGSFEKEEVILVVFDKDEDANFIRQNG